MVKEILISQYFFKNFIYSGSYKTYPEQNSHSFVTIPEFVDLDKTSFTLFRNSRNCHNTSTTRLK
ncbi:hypothetical protein NIES267_17510 [Calothrix parasitica NIES-267]|uniref:Uncharacterized protein n=1 Tax=Calothrix parasitica NIES-267 TaxID=1973488 RepID=A0A1Z4LM12_9CYAN|nr:hypothetical protein NIES267_17510 [Calothrix parasitica NIES-267]